MIELRSDAKYAMVIPTSMGTRLTPVNRAEMIFFIRLPLLSHCRSRFKQICAPRDNKIMGRSLHARFCRTDLYAGDVVSQRGSLWQRLNDFLIERVVQLGH